MEVADMMLGNWRVDQNFTENCDGYAKALKLPADVAESLKHEKNIAEETTREGDTYTMIGITGDKRQKMVFKLGEKFKTVDYGIEAENVYTVEGNMVIGKHTFLGQTNNTRRYLKDGNQVLEMEGNGETMKYVYVRY